MVFRFLCCFLAGAVCALRAPASDPAVRNVILVSIDSVRADHLELYGYPRATMPNLTRRVEERGGVVFERVTAVTSSCHPSHTAMLTGLFPHQVGVPRCAEEYLPADGVEDEEAIAEILELEDELRDRPPTLVRKKVSAVMNWLAIPADVETLATFLERQGFRTGGFTSIWTVTRRFGYDHGFETFVDKMPEYYGPRRVAWILKGAMRSQRRQVGRATMNEALEFLGRTPREQRFFVFLHLGDTHVPYAPRDAATSEESPGQRSLLEARWRSRYPPEIHERAMKAMRQPDGSFLLDRYDGALRYADEQLERLFELLETTGRFDDTLVIVTSDHGDSFGQHLYQSERFSNRLFFEHSVYVWEETQHVPMVVFDPTVRGTMRRDRRNVSHVDLVPTVLDKLRFETMEFGDGKLPGVSVLGSSDEKPSPVFFLTFGRGRPGLLRHVGVDFPKFIGFRSGDTKFFVDRARFENSRAGSCYHYDLSIDPNELDNLCQGDASDPLALAYREILVDWYSRVASGRHESRSGAKN